MAWLHLKLLAARASVLQVIASAGRESRNLEEQERRLIDRLSRDDVGDELKRSLEQQLEVIRSRRSGHADARTPPRADRSGDRTAAPAGVARARAGAARDRRAQRRGVARRAVRVAQRSESLAQGSARIVRGARRPDRRAAARRPAARRRARRRAAREFRNDEFRLEERLHDSHRCSRTDRAARPPATSSRCCCCSASSGSACICGSARARRSSRRLQRPAARRRPSPRPQPDGDAPAPIEPVVGTPPLEAAATYTPKDGVLQIDISEYAGYGGLIVANGGLEPNPDSFFAQGVRLQGQDLDERERDLVAAQQRPARRHRDDDRCARRARAASSKPSCRCRSATRAAPTWSSSIAASPR